MNDVKKNAQFMKEYFSCFYGFPYGSYGYVFLSGPFKCALGSHQYRWQVFFPFFVHDEAGALAGPPGGKDNGKGGKERRSCK